MPQRFIRRARRDKFVRITDKPTATYVAVSAENKTPEQTVKKEKTMEGKDNIEKIKDALGIEAKTPKRRVKVDKRDKGLIERTEGSAILITEDNKMVLND